jgi:carbon-monoxide dehydrogenase medium subunit
MSSEWHEPRSLEEALELKARYADEATVVAGGTFLGILLNQRLIEPERLISLGRVPELLGIDPNGALRLGAMVTHREVERSAVVTAGWPALARAFSLVASPRIRVRATVGGVLADADYASDPPAMLTALDATAVVQSVGGTREVPVDELIVGHYETTLEPDELIVEVRVPAGATATYRKFRSRSHEDRPCVAVAAARREGVLRVVVGAVAERPQRFPDLCRLGDPAEVAAAYAAAIDPLSDVRGSSSYRSRIIAVEVRRALEELG